MKKLIQLLSIILFTSSIIVSCIPEEDTDAFDRKHYFMENGSHQAYFINMHQTEPEQPGIPPMM